MLAVSATYPKGPVEIVDVPTPEVNELVTQKIKKVSPWITPVIQIEAISEAKGSQAGPLCDKHGSLSSASGPPGLDGTC